MIKVSLCPQSIELSWRFYYRLLIIISVADQKVYLYSYSLQFGQKKKKKKKKKKRIYSV